MGQFTDDLLDLMPATILVAPFLSADAFGVPSYGPSIPVRGRVVYKARLIRMSLTETINAVGVVYLATEDPVTTRDKLTLPDASSPTILLAALETDETGDCYNTVWFG